MVFAGRPVIVHPGLREASPGGRSRAGQPSQPECVGRPLAELAGDGRLGAGAQVDWALVPEGQWWSEVVETPEEVEARLQDPDFCFWLAERPEEDEAAVVCHFNVIQRLAGMPRLKVANCSPLHFSVQGREWTRSPQLDAQGQAEAPPLDRALLDKVVAEARGEGRTERDAGAGEEDALIGTPRCQAAPYATWQVITNSEERSADCAGRGLSGMPVLVMKTTERDAGAGEEDVPIGIPRCQAAPYVMWQVIANSEVSFSQEANTSEHEFQDCLDDGEQQLQSILKTSSSRSRSNSPAGTGSTMRWTGKGARQGDEVSNLLLKAVLATEGQDLQSKLKQQLQRLEKENMTNMAARQWPVECIQQEAQKLSAAKFQAQHAAAEAKGKGSELAAAAPTENKTMCQTEMDAKRGVDDLPAAPAEAAARWAALPPSATCRAAPRARKSIEAMLRGDMSYSASALNPEMDYDAATSQSRRGTGGDRGARADCKRIMKEEILQAWKSWKLAMATRLSREAGHCRFGPKEVEAPRMEVSAEPLPDLTFDGGAS
ncbi:unnamed protein product [Prorocentrum cordatum]|uniref:Uncharacterized protein n=1 Tax=Prorocentrum cordatum TaxID=2364126 RepID=A0ABN9UQU3_9DINO|nr:unnamed protein product [Polarella glacialis]